MAYNFPYLKDSSFLKQFDTIQLKEQFVKLTSLTFNEQPIAEIQGRVISGSFNLDGTSSMRRTGNINILADEYENDLTSIKNLFSINKKIQVLIGFTNTTNQYKNYDILWFPMGIYLIIAANISNSINGINISLTLHDKMALLNGECGGVLPASIILSEMEDIGEQGNTIITYPTIYQIIQQLVNHFGGEQLGKIIISDINNQAKEIMKWTGSSPLYRWDTSSGGYSSSIFSTNTNAYSSLGTPTTISYGQDVGYIYTDFTYPKDLVSKAGDTICSILDQIKNLLGNYEYFYDLNGNFVFQEIKNYLNKSYSNSIITDINNKDYQVDYTSGKSVYSFEDSKIIITITNSPQYQQIKNDFVIWGKRKSLNGTQIPIRYHLAIDKKPKTGNTYNVHFKEDIDNNTVALSCYKIMTYPTEEEMRKNQGSFDTYYYAQDKGKYYIYKNGIYVQDLDIVSILPPKTITTKDFRDELYFQGVKAETLALDSNYYYTELKQEWPKLYKIYEEDPEKRDFKDEVKNNLEEIDFFLDFIDTQSEIGKYSVENIGRRSVVLNDDTINCIFAPTIPDIVLIKNGQGDKTTNQVTQCQNRGQAYSQIDQAVYDALQEGGILKSAYEEIKKQLYQYTTFNEQVTLTAMPIYYLQPNTRITIKDIKTGINGDFMIKSISLPLDINGTMNITCTKALERI